MYKGACFPLYIDAIIYHEKRYHILQRIFYAVHRARTAKCRYSERQSRGQYHAWRVQRDFACRSCGGKSDPVCLSDAFGRIWRGHGHSRKSVLGETADRTDEEDCGDDDAAWAGSDGSPVLRDQPVPEMGDRAVYNGCGDHFRGRGVSRDHSVYLFVLCGHTAAFGSSSEYAGGEDRAVSVGDGVFCKLWN